MRRTWWFPGIIAAVTLLALTVGPSFAAEEERRVTLDFRDAPLADALRTLFRDSPFSFTMLPDLGSSRKVTVSLNEVPFSTALRAIANAANVDYARDDRDPQVYVITPRPMITTVGGAQIPVVGAMTLGPDGADAGGTGTGRNVRFVGPMDTAALLGSLDRAYGFSIPPAELGEKVVDLDVKDVPVREAMAQLSKASGLEIVVHSAVSPQIKVTARAFAVPAEWLLSTIASQSHLAVVTETIPAQPTPPPSAEELTRQLLHPRYRYYLVPPPEIRVTGAPAMPGVPVAPPAGIAPVPSPR